VAEPEAAVAPGAPEVAADPEVEVDPGAGPDPGAGSKRWYALGFTAGRVRSRDPRGGCVSVLLRVSCDARASGLEWVGSGGEYDR
jgi:hypothetical protein